MVLIYFHVALSLLCAEIHNAGNMCQCFLLSYDEDDGDDDEIYECVEYDDAYADDDV